MSNDSKQIIFSGIQPTGKMHIGNYLGMLANAVSLQEQYKQTIYCIVDLHSLTADFDPKVKSEQITELALDMLAVGIDPEKSIVFKQSDVLEHTNLAWILSTLTPMGELERMTQYKDKSSNQQHNINAGLFTYPVLMAADIMLYKANLVPVGDDQKQHIELTRKLVRKFNNQFGETFPVPKGLYTKVPRVMSLLEPEKKMSKSLGDNHCIYLYDEPEVIIKKLSRAVTATDAGQKKMPTGVQNLFTLLENFGTKEDYTKLKNEFEDGSLQYSDLKQTLAKSITDFFAPFREKRIKLAADQKKIDTILEDGAKKARAIAQNTYKEVRKKTGLS